MPGSSRCRNKPSRIASGAVGSAARSGLEFATIYLGPTLSARLRARFADHGDGGSYFQLPLDFQHLDRMAIVINDLGVAA